MRGGEEAHALQERKPSTTPGWPRTSLLSRPIETPRLMAQPQSETDAAAPTRRPSFSAGPNRPAPIANADRGPPGRDAERAHGSVQHCRRGSPRTLIRNPLERSFAARDRSPRIREPSGGHVGAKRRLHDAEERAGPGRPSGSRSGRAAPGAGEGRRGRCASHRRRFLHLAMRTANEAHRQLMSLGYGRR